MSSSGGSRRVQQLLPVGRPQSEQASVVVMCQLTDYGAQSHQLCCTDSLVMMCRLTSCGSPALEEHRRSRCSKKCESCPRQWCERSQSLQFIQRTTDNRGLGCHLKFGFSSGNTITSKSFKYRNQKFIIPEQLFNYDFYRVTVPQMH